MLKTSRLLLVLLVSTAFSPFSAAGVLSLDTGHAGLASLAAPMPQGLARGPEEVRVHKAIKRWLRLYRRGDLEPGRGAGSKSFLREARLEHLRGGGGGGGRGRSTFLDELRSLANAAAAAGSLDAAKLLLEVASVGIDRRTRYTTTMNPSSVRAVGEKALASMTDKSIRDYVVAAANGDPKGPGSLRLAMQIAALRVLSVAEGDVDLRIFQKHLAHQDSVVRLAVAESLGRKGDAFVVEWLAEALEKESSSTTMIALAWAIRDVHTRLRKRVKPEHLRRAVTAAGKHLNRASERPLAIALVGFLERFRYQDSVSVLIGLLERLAKNRSLADPKALGPAMAERVNNVLKAMTGAIYRADAPAEWRAFWDKEGANIDVTKVAKKSGAKAAKTGAAFFGIPVRGRRVVFVIDVSGSMQWRMPQQSGRTSASRGKGGIVKLTKAKDELLKAVRGLDQRHKFNVVFYSDVRSTRKWKKGLVAATDGAKKSLAGRLRTQRANGATNLFGGLKLGMEMKSQVYGSRYETSVDEIFLLSDGCPTVGDVVEMNQILKLVKETNKYSGVRINCIYLGSKNTRPQRGGRYSEAEGGEFMKKLAAQNNGDFAWPITSSGK